MEKKNGNGNRPGKRVSDAVTLDVKGAFSVLSSALNRATSEVIASARPFRSLRRVSNSDGGTPWTRRTAARGIVAP